MLSANGEMSNIFLQSGQNIDIAHKKPLKNRSNFGTGEGLTVYLRWPSEAPFQGRTKVSGIYLAPSTAFSVDASRLVNWKQSGFSTKGSGHWRGFYYYDSKRNRIL
jgi:hypothetical protein